MQYTCKMFVVPYNNNDNNYKLIYQCLLQDNLGELVSDYHSFTHCQYYQSNTPLITLLHLL